MTLLYAPDPEAQIARLSARVAELEAVIRETLDDEESRPGGWGPDVTMVLRLRDVLERTP